MEQYMISLKRRSIFIYEWKWSVETPRQSGSWELKYQFPIKSMEGLQILKDDLNNRSVELFGI